MRTIETTANVTPDGKLIAEVPADISPGEHPVVLVIEETPSTRPRRIPKPPLKLKTIHLEGWPEDCTFGRKDIYGDDGR